MRALLIQIGIELPFQSFREGCSLRALLIQIGIEPVVVKDFKTVRLRALLIQIGIEPIPHGALPPLMFESLVNSDRY